MELDRTPGGAAAAPNTTFNISIHVDPRKAGGRRGGADSTTASSTASVAREETEAERHGAARGFETTASTLEGAGAGVPPTTPPQQCASRRDFTDAATQESDSPQLYSTGGDVQPQSSMPFASAPAPAAQTPSGGLVVYAAPAPAAGRPASQDAMAALQDGEGRAGATAAPSSPFNSRVSQAPPLLHGAAVGGGVVPAAVGDAAVAAVPDRDRDRTLRELYSKFLLYQQRLEAATHELAQARAAVQQKDEEVAARDEIIAVLAATLEAKEADERVLRGDVQRLELEVAALRAHHGVAGGSQVRLQSHARAASTSMGVSSPSQAMSPVAGDDEPPHAAPAPWHEQLITQQLHLIQSLSARLGIAPPSLVPSPSPAASQHPVPSHHSPPVSGGGTGEGGVFAAAPLGGDGVPSTSGGALPPHALGNGVLTGSLPAVRQYYRCDTDPQPSGGPPGATQPPPVTPAERGVFDTTSSVAPPSVFATPQAGAHAAPSSTTGGLRASWLATSPTSDPHAPDPRSVNASYSALQDTTSLVGLPSVVSGMSAPQEAGASAAGTTAAASNAPSYVGGEVSRRGASGVVAPRSAPMSAADEITAAAQQRTISIPDVPIAISRNTSYVAPPARQASVTFAPALEVQGPPSGDRKRGVSTRHGSSMLQPAAPQPSRVSQTAPSTSRSASQLLAVPGSRHASVMSQQSQPHQSAQGSGVPQQPSAAPPSQAGSRQGSAVLSGRAVSHHEAPTRKGSAISRGAPTSTPVSRASRTPSGTPQHVGGMPSNPPSHVQSQQQPPSRLPSHMSQGSALAPAAQPQPSNPSSHAASAALQSRAASLADAPQVSRGGMSQGAAPSAAAPSDRAVSEASPSRQGSQVRAPASAVPSQPSRQASHTSGAARSVPEGDAGAAVPGSRQSSVAAPANQDSRAGGVADAAPPSAVSGASRPQASGMGSRQPSAVDSAVPRAPSAAGMGRQASAGIDQRSASGASHPSQPQASGMGSRQPSAVDPAAASASAAGLSRQGSAAVAGMDQRSASAASHPAPQARAPASREWSVARSHAAGASAAGGSAPGSRQGSVVRGPSRSGSHVSGTGAPGGDTAPSGGLRTPSRQGSVAQSQRSDV